MTAPGIPNLGRVAHVAQDRDFIDRIQAATLFKARQIVSLGTPQDAPAMSRYQYAMGIARNPSNFAPGAAWVVATDTEIATVLTVSTLSDEAGAQGLITDAQILAALGRAWDALAGIGA